MRSAGPSLRVWTTALLTGAAFQLFLGYRSDYLGHYWGGFGGALLLLGLVSMFSGKLTDGKAAAVTLLAVGLGFGTEMTIFKIAKFDPVDFANQSAGACIAGLCLLNREWTRGRAARLFISGAILGILGTFVAHHS